MMKLLSNAKYLIRALWRYQSWPQWRLVHYTLDYAKVHYIHKGNEVPVFTKYDKVPHLSSLSMHCWILFYGFAPIILHQLYISFTGYNIGSIMASFIYVPSTGFSANQIIKATRILGQTCGFFDGHHARDSVPDKTVIIAFLSLLARPIMAICFAYDMNSGPLSMNWFWILSEISVYGIVVDFWYYWYHRLMHEVDGLWTYHRTHHLTKYPTTLFAAYFDAEQALFDVAVIPIMAIFSMKLMHFPMGFYEWHICQMYVLYAEALGHSGLRVHAVIPNPLSWLLEIFDAELITEDHDIHHRHGWRKSYNYGKQTRLWDRVFGTCRDRIDATKGNVDYDGTIRMPLF